MQLRNGFILLKKIKQLDAYCGSILLPNLPRNIRGGEVVQLSAAPSEVQVGDRVLVDHFAGVDFEQQGEKFLLISEVDVLVYMRRNDASHS
jgi:co-chaperonin GroES (HSP10)